MNGQKSKLIWTGITIDGYRIRSRIEFPPSEMAMRVECEGDFHFELISEPIVCCPWPLVM